MANVICKKNAKDGMAITLITSSDFKKNSTFASDAEYVVMQNKKVLGYTKAGSSLTTANAQLNDKCFPGLQYHGFLSGKVDAGIWVLQKTISVTGTLKKMLPTDRAEKTDVNACFSAKLTLVDPMKAMQALMEKTQNLYYPVSKLRDVFLDYAELTVSAYLKKRAEKAGASLKELKMNYLTKDSPLVSSAFKPISSVINKLMTEDLGYSAEVQLSLY